MNLQVGRLHGYIDGLNGRFFSQLERRFFFFDGRHQHQPQKQIALRVHVPNNWVLRVLVIVIVVQVLGKYMIIG